MGLLLVTITILVAITQTTTAVPTTSDLKLKPSGNFGPSTSLPALQLDEDKKVEDYVPSDDYYVDDREDEMMNRARAIVFRPIFTYREKQAKRQRIYAQRRRAAERRNLQRRAAQEGRRRFSAYVYSSPYSSSSGYPSYYPKWYVNAPFSYTL